MGFNLIGAKSAIIENGAVYFDLTEEVKDFVFDDYNKKFNATFNDSLGRKKTELYKIGKTVLNEIYRNGVLEEDYNYPNDKNVVLLDGQNQIASTTYSELSKIDAFRKLLERQLEDKKDTKYSSVFVSMFFDLIEPNLKVNKSITKNALDEELNKISTTHGNIERETLIISKGELVEGHKYDVLKSLESEYESQVWNSSNYTWVVISYSILVALTLLMLLLFLRKYHYACFP